jgi:hypothetical protein
MPSYMAKAIPKNILLFVSFPFYIHGKIKITTAAATLLWSI